MERTYSELRKIQTIEDRYEYLKVHSSVGVDTFGYDRWLNQAFYTSTVWRQVRYEVITRDNGCDLGVDGYEIHGHIIIHHMNPIQVRDIVSHATELIDPEFLISTSLTTHNAIHYGDARLLPRPFVPRQRGDTKLW